MDPGEFDKRITVTTKVRSGRDAVGAPVEHSAPELQPWAKVVQGSGREFLSGEGESSERRVVFRLYRDDRVTTDSVVRYGDIDHDIQDIRAFDDVMELHTVARAKSS